jgi:penicillin-binding protein 1C
MKLSLLATPVLVVFLLVCVFPRVRLTAPPASPLFEDRNGVFLSEGNQEGACGQERLGYWEVSLPLPKRIRSCILMIEDKRFYSHVGVDLRAVVRALYNNLLKGGSEGASTIAMQVARMQDSAPRNLWNKIVETAVALLLIQRYGHEEVLRHYMKIVPQGNQIYGFSYAARRYFKKPLQDLSWAEAAILASLPKAPDLYNLFKFKGLLSALSRARLILGLLYREGKLDEETYLSSQRELSRFRTPFKETRPSHSYHFIFRVLEDYNGGRPPLLDRPLRTTLDLRLQDHLQKVVRHTVESYRSYGVGNIAAIVADRHTGEVLGYIGSVDYFDQDYSGSIDYARTPRSSASTLKPFIYAFGLETRRFSPSSILADLPFHIVNLDGQYSFSYSNVDDEFLGPMIYRHALANSRNIPAIRVLAALGLKETYDFLGRLGLHADDRPAEHYGYGMAIGGLYVTLEDLVEAYGILANEGKFFFLRWLSEGSAPDGGTQEPPRERLISEPVARQISLFLSDPLARLPSFGRLSTLEFPFPVAIKTGTSQGFRDSWALAYTSKYVVGVWLGHPKNDRMNHVGSYVSAGIVQSILLYLQPKEAKGINTEPFPPPRNFVPVKLCLLSGQVAGDDCPRVTLEYFPKGSTPKTKCQVHRRYAVDKKDGILADLSTPPHRIVTRAFCVLPPQFAVWGSKKGYGTPPTFRLPRAQAFIKIVEPPDGSRYILDPETPRTFQSLPLRAEVMPTVPEIVWLVDGKEYRRVCYPYEVRWLLDVGEHTIQARFSNANVTSETVSVTIAAY